MTHRSYVLLGFLLIMSGACALPPNSGNLAQPQLVKTALEVVEEAPKPSSFAPSSVSALLRFVELEQGGIIYARTDEVTGLPTASVRVESNDSRLPLGLEADGLLVAIHTNKRGTAPYQVELAWTPWHGNGRYVLNLQLLDWQNHNIPSSRIITVNVVGILESIPTMRSRFIELYRDHFGLNLTAPVFARHDAPDRTPGEESRWVSAAYIGDRLYEISIFDDGTISSRSYATHSDDGGGFCRPSGRIRMLAVVVDYGNTGLDPADAEAALQTGLEEAERHWAAYSRKIGLSEPILEVELTTFAFGAPPQAGRYITADEIRSASGPDPAGFDLLTEIDLDKDNSTTGQYGGLGVSLGDGCRPSGSRRTNIAFTVMNRNSLEHAMAVSVFEHELTHSMGWMHWWPNQAGDGPSWVHSSRGWEPYLMFGWTDVDGDGVVEILDQTPYGLTQ
jgi:hypothetical protein